MKIKREVLVNNNAITLISLVITIVILIILAGVAISMTLGENGIFTKAKEAKKMQAIATAKEQIGLEILEAQIEAMENNEELEQAKVETIVAKYGVLQTDGDTIILNNTEYEVSLREIYNEMAETETDGDTTELAQLKALLAQTTIAEDKILKDYKAYKDGKLIIGTMEDYSGQTQDATVASDDNYTYLSIPSNGYYTTDSKLRTSNSDLNNYFLLENKEQNANVTYTYDLGFTPSRVFILDGSFRYVWAYYNINISTTTYQGWYNVEYDNAQLGNTSSDVYFDIEDTIIKYKLPNSHKPTTIIAFK